MTSRQSQNEVDIHFRAMRLLQDDPQMTQRELARALDISLGRANYCLNALLTKGWIKIQNFRSSKRKLAYAYLLTPRGIAEKAALTRGFLKRKMNEFEGLKAEILALQKDLERASTATVETTDAVGRPHA